MVKSKDTQIKEVIRWQVEEERYKYLDEIELTATRPIKKSISEEHQIVMIELYEYP